MVWVISHQPITTEGKFDDRETHVIFVTGKLVSGQVFLWAVRFYAASIVPPMAHTLFNSSTMAVFALSHWSNWIKHQKEIQKSSADLGKLLGMELEPADVEELLNS